MKLRNRLEVVVAGMGDALVAMDADGRVTDFNHAAEKLTGVEATDAMGQPGDAVLALVDEDGSSLGDRVRHSYRAWAGVATVAHIRGGQIPVAVSAGLLRGADDRVVGSVLVLRDLRREREVERMKAEFLSRAGDELRSRTRA